MPVNVFICYAHEDEPLLNKLKDHVKPLQRQGLIHVWYDRDISAGTEWEREISKHLNEADIILLLVSPDFMASDYCYGIEMKRALERHERGEARVIPIILRPVYWQGVLGKLQALPTDAKPVISASWHNIDEALLDVAEGIRKVVEQVITKPSISPPIKEFESETEHAQQIVQFQRDPVAGQFIQHISGNAQVGIAGVNYGPVNIHQTTHQGDLSWQEDIKVTLKEFILFWTIIYGKKDQKLADPFLSKLQSKLILTSEQLISILSWNTRDIPIEVASDIGNLASRLEDLGRMRLVFQSGPKFNELGDGIVKDIEILIEQLDTEAK
jgi:hypothetical protein